MASVRSRAQLVSNNPFDDIIERRAIARRKMAEQAATAEEQQSHTFAEWDECCTTLLTAVGKCLDATANGSRNKKRKTRWLFASSPFKVIGDEQSRSWKLFMFNGEHRRHRRDVRGRRIHDANAEVKLMFDAQGNATHFLVDYVYGMIETNEVAAEELQQKLRELLISGKLD